MCDVVDIAASIDCRLSGGLAQLGEHYVRNVGVGGSTPLPSTIRLAGESLMQCSPVSLMAGQ